MTRGVLARTAVPTLIAGCALIGGLGAAWASPQICPIYPSEQWMPMAQVEQRARAMGYDKFFVQPDGGTNGLATDDFDRQGQLARHVAQHHQLLIVLFSEQRRLRLNDVEQLENDGRHAAEMAGAELAVELVLNGWWLDVVLLRLGVEIALGGCKKDVDAGRGELLAILLQGARIKVEVVTGSELQAVDENAGDDGVSVGARRGHQRDVAGVQVAHGRDKNDPATLHQRLTQLGDRGVNLHMFCGPLVKLVENASPGAPCLSLAGVPSVGLIVVLLN